MKDVRNIVQKVIEELYQGNHYAYPTSTRNEFPYMGDDEGGVSLPQDINPEQSEFMYNNQLTAENKAMDEFPMAEFHIGLKIERNKNDILPIMDVAEKVIQRLKDNAEFYTQMTAPKVA